MNTLLAAPRQTTGETGELERFLAMLPRDLASSLHSEIEQLEEIVLDLHTPLRLAYGDGRLVELERRTTRADLETVKYAVGRFRDDGRRGVDGTLHRISAAKNDDGQIVRITLRIGRYVPHVAEPLRK